MSRKTKSSLKRLATVRWTTSNAHALYATLNLIIQDFTVMLKLKLLVQKSLYPAWELVVMQIVEELGGIQVRLYGLDLVGGL